MQGPGALVGRLDTSCWWCDIGPLEQFSLALGQGAGREWAELGRKGAEWSRGGGLPGRERDQLHWCAVNHKTLSGPDPPAPFNVDLP